MYMLVFFFFSVYHNNTPGSIYICVIGLFKFFVGIFFKIQSRCVVKTATHCGGKQSAAKLPHLAWYFAIQASQLTSAKLVYSNLFYGCFAASDIALNWFHKWQGFLFFGKNVGELLRRKRNTTLTCRKITNNRFASVNLQRLAKGLRTRAGETESVSCICVNAVLLYYCQECDWKANYISCFFLFCFFFAPRGIKLACYSWHRGSLNPCVNLLWSLSLSYFLCFVCKKELISVEWGGWAKAATHHINWREECVITALPHQSGRRRTHGWRMLHIIQHGVWIFRVPWP